MSSKSHDQNDGQTTQLRDNKWIISGTSVRGATHVRSGFPNQDSIRWLSSNKDNLQLLSIADGHGSKIHFRSKTGSYLATKVSVSVLNNFFSRIELTVQNISKIRDLMRYSLPRLIVEKWNDMVFKHMKTHPISGEEVSNSLGEQNHESLELISANPSIIYGSTLLSVVVTSNFVFCFQIGDGDIVIIDKNDQVHNPFNPLNEKLSSESIAFSMDRTNSLCMSRSWDKFDVKIYSIHDLHPQLILLATDGYSNSFRKFDGFLKIGIDYLNLLHIKGPEYLKWNLDEILKVTSERGSGDDITLGYLYRPTA